jgi:hypothetical protein
MQEWSGRLSFTDVGAIVYYLKAVPWLVPGLSIETHSQHLLTLQRRLESGEGLTFIERKYLIEAYQKGHNPLLFAPNAVRGQIPPAQGGGKSSRHVKIKDLASANKYALRYYIKQTLEFDAK